MDHMCKNTVLIVSRENDPAVTRSLIKTEIMNLQGSPKMLQRPLGVLSGPLIQLLSVYFMPALSLFFLASKCKWRLNWGIHC